MIKRALDIVMASVGLVEFEDAETGHRVWLDTADAGVRQQFNDRALADAVERDRQLASLGVDVVPISTDDDYIVPLTAYLQARARRR